jgi:GAF domain-containing protein
MTRRSKVSGKLPKARRQAAAKRDSALTRRRRSSGGDQKNKITQVNRERDEALEQLSAASEVLKVISSSAGDLKPVFDTILENATRLCEAKFGNLWLRENAKFRIVAVHGGSPEYREYLFDEPLVAPDPESAMARIAGKKEVVQIDDVSTAPTYGMRMRIATIKIAKARSLVGVPMLRDNEVVGIVAVYRQEVRPFTDRQIALLRNFADQAVIAIENARLLSELRESLQQQTATSEVLRVISSSPSDLAPVFQTMLANATRLCDANFGLLLLYDGDWRFRVVAMSNVPPAFAELRRREPIFEASPETGLGRAVASKDVVHIADYADEAIYKEQRHPAAVALGDLGGARTYLVVPMLKDKQISGAIAIYRQQVRPFADKQIELVKSFASQAVIAIENTRLLNELRESLRQQTATADVLKTISRSTFDLRRVLDTLTESAAVLCEADMASMVRPEGDHFVLLSNYRFPQAFVDLIRTMPVRAGRGSLAGRVLAERGAVHIPDVLADPDYEFGEGQKAAAFRSMLGMPLLRDGAVLGIIILTRLQARPYTEKQIELATTFADQAVIAIENVRLFEAEQERSRELSESLEQQTATSEVLKVISASPGELEPVFQAILENAVHICDASFGNLLLYEGDAFRHVALHNAPQAWAAEQKRDPIAPRRSARFLYRVADTKQIVHIADVAAENPHEPIAKVAGARTLLIVPMLKESDLIGVIAIYRQEVRPFGEKQIELVENFAAQAVIAIENARLLNELRQRTADLTESLEQQTATSEVLKVISASPGELEPVFEAMLQNSVRICEAGFGQMFLREGDNVRLVAAIGVSAALVEFDKRRGAFQPSSGGGLEQVMRTKQVAHIADLASEHASYPPAKLGGARSYVAVPMLREGQLVGAFAIYRQEVRPFTDKQVALVQNFAAQAVIAIENARLLNELRESLQQQTATAEVLQVINSSAGSLAPVFEAMLDRAMHLCEAAFGGIWTLDGDRYTAVALQGVPERYAKFVSGLTLFPGPGTAPYRIMHGEAFVHNVDLKAEEPYQRGDPQRRALVDLGGARTALQAALRKDDAVLGIITIYRQEVRPYTEKQIELLQNFAAQAVVAMENARLLNELRQSLQQQTATADVLKVISRSTFDLQAVLNTLAESAVQLCEADIASIHRQRGNDYQTIAIHGAVPEQITELELRNVPFTAGRGSVLGRTVAECRPIQISDVLADPDYSLLDIQRKVGFRTIMGVPILREGNPIGVVVLMRVTVRPFSKKQIELATTFADQAGIAIENVRLFDEIQDKSRQLEEASKHKSQFLANMSHELRTPLNAILGYTELMADGAYGEPSEKMGAVLKRLESNGRHLLGLINDVLDLSKIEAGQLVLDLNDYSLQGVTQTVYSAVEPLAADKKLGFKVELTPDLPPGRGDERRLTQVLLNLVGNAIKFTDSGEVCINVGVADGAFKVAVRDTGPGISAADQAKLFQEFQQADNSITRKKGGTGLGLAISKRIIEMHGGRIWIDSTLGQGSTFLFTVPVRVERQVESETGAQ